MTFPPLYTRKTPTHWKQSGKWGETYRRKWKPPTGPTARDDTGAVCSLTTPSVHDHTMTLRSHPPTLYTCSQTVNLFIRVGNDSLRCFKYVQTSSLLGLETRNWFVSSLVTGCHLIQGAPQVSLLEVIVPKTLSVSQLNAPAQTWNRRTTESGCRCLKTEPEHTHSWNSTHVPSPAPGSLHHYCFHSF